MEQIILNAHIRDNTGKSVARQLRQGNAIPAVVYKQKEKTLHIQVGATDFIRILRTSAGENAIITLKISPSEKAKGKSSGTPVDKTVIIKEIQYHPIKEGILHVDFQQISLTEKITVKVPIILRGEAVGVKIDGGVLEQMTKELEIECLPTQIPQKIEANIEAMKIADVIHVKELTVPANIRVITDPEQAVASVSPPKAEEALAPKEAAEEIQEPEVITERKPEEEEEAEEEGETKKEKEKEK